MKHFALVIFLVSLPAMAAQKVATVKLLRGQANVVTGGSTAPLKLEDWVEEGSLIKTFDKSFVKLIFIDRSSMNVGPNSEMKIEKFDGKDAGVIDVVRGQIRSQVTKDYLQIQDKDKSKLFMKTSNAVMGVRGTDFMITTNGLTTSTVLFEGEVVFNSLPEGSQMAPAQLERVVDQGVRVQPGEFSVVQADFPQPTVPSTLNLQQREILEKNDNLESSDRSPSSAAAEPMKTVVPEGLTGAAVSNSSDTLKGQVAEITATAPAETGSSSSGNAAGFVSGDSVKPANGSFLHLGSGSIVPPPADSVFDENTNSFIPAPGNGTVAEDGSYVPPEGVQITDDGKVLVTVTAQDGAQKTVEIQKSPPVVSATAPTLTQVTSVISATPSLQNATAPISTVAIANVTGPASVSAPAPIIVVERPVSGAPTPAEYQVIQKTEAAKQGQLNIEVIR
jgi:hypothetical protein